MSLVKDFTAKQAAKWVAQEAEKHTTSESCAARVASERKFIETAVAYGFDVARPNAINAHRELIVALGGAR